MPATSKRKTQPARGRSGAPDAMGLLKTDHRELQKLFAEFAALKAGASARKEMIADRICTRLRAHMRMEGEILYPALRSAGADGERLDEAEVEHAIMHGLVGEIETMMPGDRLYEAKVEVLSVLAKHHFAREERITFRQARDSGVDLSALGRRMAKRKSQLMPEEIMRRAARGVFAGMLSP